MRSSLTSVLLAALLSAPAGAAPAPRLSALSRAIPKALTPDLLKPARRKLYDPANPLKGHCYVASEALYHLLGGKEAGWTPVRLRHEDDQHWWLRHEDGTVADLTAGQFKTPVPYEKGVGSGFMTREPSKRAVELMRRVAGELASPNARMR